MFTIHFDTLQTETVEYTDRKGRPRSYESQTVEITLRGDRRRVSCHSRGDSTTIGGLAVRFRTGTKVWPGSAVYWAKTGNINNLRPNIDKFSGQFCSLVGFFEDHADSKHRSQHNAVA
jgi:hypothetical protein